MVPPFNTRAEVHQLVRSFEECTLPRERWKHHAHLAVGLWYLAHHPEAEALRRIREGIQRYNAAASIGVSPMGGYHETLTVFWFRVVREYLHLAGLKPDLVETTNSLIAARADKQLPFEYYSQKQMWSPEARSGWVWPDLKPFPHTLGGLVVEPVTLEGENVRLEPLSLRHLSQLSDVGLDEDLWHWTTLQIRSAGDMRHYIESAVHAHEHGHALPFATFEKRTGLAVGCTRFGNIDRGNRRMEIGWTWVARPWQRSPMNTEAKLLMMQHAFETLGCLRVELKTDALNERSRAAIQRLGAKEEGILRAHMITSSGRVRDTVYYSVVASEWPAVKENLQKRIQRKADVVAAG